MMATVAKIEGDISAEQKRTVLRLYEQEFHLTKKDASFVCFATASMSSALFIFFYLLHNTRGTTRAEVRRAGDRGYDRRGIPCRRA